MATPDRYERIHQLLSERAYSIQGLSDQLGMSRVTVTKVVKTSSEIEEHKTWPRTYTLKSSSKFYMKKDRPDLILNESEIAEAQKYLEILLKPDTSIDLATQFQAVDSVEGADALIKALTDCIKVAEYYKMILRA